jgi:hypothetical protein
VKDYIPMLKRLIQKDLFLEVVKPYTNISMQYIGKRIHTTPEETESIVVELILNQQIQVGFFISIHFNFITCCVVAQALGNY